MMAHDDDELCFVREFMDAMTFIIRFSFECFIIGAALSVDSTEIMEGERLFLSHSLHVSFARFRMLRKALQFIYNNVLNVEMVMSIGFERPIYQTNRNNSDAFV